MDHQGLLVGRDRDADGNGGWTYGSANGSGPDSNEFMQFDTLEEALNSDAIGERYDRAYHIESSPGQDAAMIGEMREEVGEDYNFVGNNCGDLVHDSLQAGEIDVRDTINPAAMENALRNEENWEDISDRLQEQ